MVHLSAIVWYKDDVDSFGCLTEFTRLLTHFTRRANSVRKVQIVSADQR